jgi:hypothetical protein
VIYSFNKCVPSPNKKLNLITQPAAETDRNQKTKMPQHPACRPSTLPYLHSASSARLTSHFASVTAPAAKSCSTTAACPFIAAECSGVSPSCGAQQRSGRHSLTPGQGVRPFPHPRPLVSPNIQRGQKEMERDNLFAAKPRCHGKLVWDW